MDRNGRFRNVYAGSPTDAPWVGDLGEILFDRWLREDGRLSVEWNTTNVVGSADFNVNGQRVGLKTVKRAGQPKLSYTSCISARHIDEPADAFAFASYELAERRLWILGVIHRDDFARLAERFGPGEMVHAWYRVPDGHSILNISNSELGDPLAWRTWVAELPEETNQ